MTTATASSGWTDDTASEHLLHPSTSRCWWREGEFGPSEYGNAGADPTPGSITCSAASRGSSIDDDTGYQTQSIQHYAPHQGWHARPVGPVSHVHTLWFPPGPPASDSPSHQKLPPDYGTAYVVHRRQPECSYCQGLAQSIGP